LSDSGKLDVFVSYSNEDKEVADRVISRLERDGVSCWISHRDARPGAEWAESIVDAIENSKVVILIYTAHSNDSQQVLREMERAVYANVPILPFLIEDHPLSRSMSYFLGATHWLNVSKDPIERGVDKLADAIGPVLRAASKGLRPGAVVLPTPQRLKQLYWAAILIPIALALVAVAAGSEDIGIAALLGADVGLPFGVYGLLWGRASWKSSAFAMVLFVLGTIFVATVIMPLL
jgi:hypothetical protein